MGTGDPARHLKLDGKLQEITRRRERALIATVGGRRQGGGELAAGGDAVSGQKSKTHSLRECMVGAVATLLSDADPLPGGELAAFAAAVESGSVQGAADALQLTQSAATKRIQSLERRIGDPLLDRGRFGARPTALGRTVYPLAKRALDALADVAHAVELSAAQSTKQLRLSASLTIGEFLLPSWLARFRFTARTSTLSWRWSTPVR
jgi:molybdenum-dependent DNA-binding transcriptional regulator ModE